MIKIILTTAYLPNIQYFSKIISSDLILIEHYENYSKQTFRNRCEIYGANEKLSLSVPVVKNHNKKILIKDVEIDYDTNWQNNHWKSIRSAYNSSPFFKHYEFYFSPFYHKRFKFLFDFNLEIIHTVLSVLEIKRNIENTSSFVKSYDDIIDYRYAFHPKIQFAKNDFDFEPVVYNQVFSPKHGFIPNLSIIDLIFNEGPNSIDVLKK